MTLRTTSATRRSVVSRSSEVASTSATSSSSDSAGDGSGLDTTELILVMIAAAFCWLPERGTQRIRPDRETAYPIRIRAGVTPWELRKYRPGCGTFRHSQGHSRLQIHLES